MKKILFVILILESIFFAGCSQIVPIKEYDALKADRDGLRSQITELKGQINALEEKNTELENQIEVRRERETPDPFDETILGNLFQRPDLIPVGGEDMRYFPDLCRVLGEKYVYAYAEDGRNTADMIFSYHKTIDETIEWKLEAYDKGRGWQLAEEKDVVTDTTGTVPAPNETPSDSASSQVAESQEPSSSSSTASETDNSSSTAALPPEPVVSQPSVSTPAVGVPVPNEAQQQKFREIASLVS